MKGYLSGASRSLAEDQTKRLREVTKQEEELIQVEQEIERTIAVYEKKLAQNL